MLKILIIILLVASFCSCTYVTVEKEEPIPSVHIEKKITFDSLELEMRCYDMDFNIIPGAYIYISYEDTHKEEIMEYGNRIETKLIPNYEIYAGVTLENSTQKLDYCSIYYDSSIDITVNSSTNLLYIYQCDFSGVYGEKMSTGSIEEYITYEFENCLEDI